MLCHDLDMISLSDWKKMKDNMILLMHDDSSIPIAFFYHEDSRVDKMIPSRTDLF